MSGRLLKLVVVTACMLSSAAVPASAHVKTSSGKWLFTGSTYNTNANPPERDHRSDPINVVWRGPSGTFANIERAITHINTDWRDRYVPGRYPRGNRMGLRDNPFCTGAQWVFMRRGNAANDGESIASAAYMSTNAACGDQYHTRMWSSYVHGAFFGDDHRNEWVLTPIHHDHLVLRCRARIFPCRPEHAIDLPFDQARSVFVHAMKRVHCYERKWAVHPESAGFPYGAGDGQGPYSGIITRISFKHESEGCNGA